MNNHSQRMTGLQGSERGLLASLCLIIREHHLRRDLAEKLRFMGFSVHEFHCGAAFLLSGAPGIAEAIVSEFHLTGITLPELRAALASEGLHLPVVLISHPDDDQAARAVDDREVETVAADSPIDVLLNAVRTVLARRTR